ncbi:Gfo/Idh/MocA family protein [Paenibacillus senegalensis]|uniref:Gfo/Idh/MocA family protein n=1 Tax=Paenibacillus senegalensis TaxID=1465766 RepID=UPI000287D43E|nr:Gfo/Idh/MocA family oxidoreductase [Paenibacillus senegalensis]
MIRFGIVGMGIRGSLYANTIEQNPYAEVTAISDVDPERLKQYGQQYKAKGYTQVDEMLREETLDAIIIATPDFLHKEPVLAAAAKGLHIMIEKPLATNVEEAEEMAEAVERAGTKCLIAFENRWNSPFVAAKEAIQRGELGSIVTMNARLNDTIYVPTKMLKWSKGSTPGWFLFPHATDIGCWFKGSKPVQVYAVGTKKKLVAMGIDTYDSIQAVVTFEDQTHATFTTSWILPESMPLIYDFKYEIIGEDGALYLDLSDQMVRQAGGSQYKHVHTLGTPINGTLTSAPSYMLNAFIDNIRLGTEPDAGVRDGLMNTKLVHAIHRSVETGSIVKL